MEDESVALVAVEEVADLVDEAAVALEVAEEAEGSEAAVPVDEAEGSEAVAAVSVEDVAEVSEEINRREF